LSHSAEHLSQYSTELCTPWELLVSLQVASLGPCAIGTKGLLYQQDQCGKALVLSVCIREIIFRVFIVFSTFSMAWNILPALQPWGGWLIFAKDLPLPGLGSYVSWSTATVVVFVLVVSLGTAMSYQLRPYGPYSLMSLRSGIFQKVVWTLLCRALWLSLSALYPTSPYVQLVIYCSVMLLAHQPQHGFLLVRNTALGAHTAALDEHLLNSEESPHVTAHSSHVPSAPNIMVYKTMRFISSCP
jgi:hypothetical protein